MIIWTGLGFLVFVIVFVVSLIFNLGFNAFWGDKYYTTHLWPFGTSLLVSALLCWPIGQALRRRKAQVVIDKATGQEFTIERGSHTLFFIPMHLWAPVLALIALAHFVVELVRR